MENKTYVVPRENIYVGEVIRIVNDIYRYDGETDLFRTKPGQLAANCWESLRSMLFVLDENKMANDLIYKSPHYPILNITDDKVCLNLTKNSVAIQEAYNIAPLLEHFGFKEYLTIDDIIRIRKIFFNGRFGKDNSKLFGYEEIIPSDFKPYISDPKERYAYFKRSLALNSERQFKNLDTSVLPKELMSILDERGKRQYEPYEKSFKPCKDEGPIKKLTRF